MKFDQVSHNISYELIKYCEKQIQLVLLDLALRSDNIYIGSGRGGNSAQLFAISSLQNHLTDEDDIYFISSEKCINWGALALCKGILSIRLQIDRIMPDIESCTKGQYIVPIIVNANMICDKFAKELDKGNTSNIGAIVDQLSIFPLEAVIIALRDHLTIERLLKYNIDEHPLWHPLLHQINDMF